MSVTVDGVTYTLPRDAARVAALGAGQFNLALRMLRNSPADAQWVTFEMPADANRVAQWADGPYALALKILLATRTDARWESLIAQQRERLGPGAAAAAVLPPNERAQRWSRIKVIEKPYPEPDGDDKRCFGFWFNYFWAEASTMPEAELSLGDKARLCDTFFAVFDLAAGAPQVRADFAALPDERKRALLTTLLVIGFKRVAVTGVVPQARDAIGNGGKVMAVARAVNATELMVNKLELNHGGRRAVGVVQGTQVHVGYRSDTREYLAIVADGGMQARARSGMSSVYAECGLDQAWNPLGLEVYANSLFLRRGEKKRDNCLYTVVSVGFTFQQLPDYPVVTSAGDFPLLAKRLKDWNEADILAAQAHRWKVRAVKAADGSIDHLEQGMRIYVLRLDEAKGFGTSRWQDVSGVPNPADEIGIQRIKARDILGEVTFKRLIFDESVGKDAPASYTVYSLIDYQFTPRPDAQTLATQFDVSFPDRLAQHMQTQFRGAQAYYSGSMARYHRARQAVVAAPARPGCPHCGAAVAAIAMKVHLQLCPKRPQA